MSDNQQITLSDAVFGLTDREKRMLEKSWAKPFSEKIFPLIDESRFACLYSNKASRPNTPVNMCLEPSVEQKTLVTYGAYSGETNRQLAKSRNIDLVTTDLLGRDAKNIYADFQFSEVGTRILLCPAGYQPKSTSFVKSIEKVRTSFHKNKCENCPHKNQCNPKISNKTSAVYISKASHERAKSQRFTETWQFKYLTKVRNGVETIPSVLRRKYGIDTMPVRGKIQMKHLFVFKIGALNFRKLLKYLDSLERCALNPEIV